MVLGEAETYPLDLGLKILLWVELVLYLVCGMLLFFKPDYKKPPSHLKNNFDIFMWATGEQVHACLAFVLGYVALQGLLSGKVSRFELEMSFVILGMLMGMVWNCPPGLVWFFIKPETYLTLVMWIFYSGLVRWQVLAVAGLFNVYGIIKKLTNKKWGSYAEFRTEMAESLGEDNEDLQKFDKLNRYKAGARELSEPILTSGTLN